MSVYGFVLELGRPSRLLGWFAILYGSSETDFLPLLEELGGCDKTRKEGILLRNERAPQRCPSLSLHYEERERQVEIERLECELALFLFCDGLHQTKALPFDYTLRTSDHTHPLSLVTEHCQAVQ